MLSLGARYMKNDEGIYSREDFLDFLNWLHIDFLENQREWKNISAGDYIESIYSWLKDSRFPLKEKGISFNDLKEIFISGKYYE